MGSYLLWINHVITRLSFKQDAERVIVDYMMLDLGSQLIRMAHNQLQRDKIGTVLESD